MVASSAATNGVSIQLSVWWRVAPSHLGPPSHTLAEASASSFSDDIPAPCTLCAPEPPEAFAVVRPSSNLHAVSIDAQHTRTQYMIPGHHG